MPALFKLLKHLAKVLQKIVKPVLCTENIKQLNIVYRYMTNTVIKLPQSAETHARRAKKNFNNVDILSLW